MGEVIELPDGQDRLRRTVAERRWADAGIPNKYWGLRLKGGYHPTAANRAAIGAVAEFIENFPLYCPRRGHPIPQEREKIGRGLLLYGPPGTGKTMLAAIAAMEVRTVHKVGVFFTSFADYIAGKLEQLRWAEWRNHPDADERFWKLQHVIDTVADGPLVVLDDINKEHHTTSKFAQDELDALLRGRQNRGRTTILTSNLETDEGWDEIYNSSMASFLRGGFTMITCGTRDRRR